MNKKINVFLNYLIPFIFLFTILLSFYPGIISYDGDNQWQQVQSGIITNAHPFFSTFFMLLLSKIWNSITVVVIYQIILFSVSWGYLCKTIRANDRKQSIVMYLFTMLILLLPLTSIYSVTVWKDIIYTLYLFICGIMFFDWSKSNFNFNPLKYTIWGIIIAMVFSYRHNGIMVAIFLLLIFYVICFKNYRNKIIDKISLKKTFIVGITFFTIILLIAVPKSIFLENSSKKIKNESSANVTSTIDGYMLWMMGAHIKDNNIKNKSDIDFLNKIIPFNEWKKAYNPYLINNTNLTPQLDRKFLNDNISKFRKKFVKYSIRNPITIFKHYIKADSLLINPVASINGYIYVDCFQEINYIPKYAQIKSIIPQIKSFYIKMYRISLSKPFIIFYQPAFILYLSLMLSLILAKKVYGKMIWLFSLPMILNIISLLPINLAQDLRYVYINYLTFYGLMLMFVLNFKKIFNMNNKK